MADLVITKTEVKKGTNARTANGIAGVTITAGQLLYKDSADSKIKLADANDTSTDDIVGIALCDATLDQPIVYQNSGDVVIGASASPAKTVYGLSSNAGGIAPCADLGAGEFISLIGVGDGDATIKIQIQNSGIQI